jgi:nicotinate-nucleotide adenylyltransferase
MKRSQYSWTIDTVDELIGKYSGNTYYFISGSEGFLKIRTWKNYKKLLDTLSFIVLLRKEPDRANVERLLKEEGILPSYRNNMIEQNHIPAKKPAVYLFTYQSEHLFISSTLIRKKIKQSGYQSVKNFVCQETKEIMEENNLYEK